MRAPVVGVDVGGTKIAAARLVDKELEAATVVPTELSDSQALLDQLVDVCEATSNAETRAFGIGVPSVVEFATGIARSSVNIPLAGVSLRQVLASRLGRPVYVDNDANCAALAEAYDGERISVSDLVMLTLGTGIGGGLILAGRPYRGTTGAAAELGQTVIQADDALDSAVTGFPKPGSFEALASGRALDRLATEQASLRPESRLGRTMAGGARVGGQDVVAAARAGDTDALETIDFVADRIGVGVANAINTFDPGVVALGGGFAAAGSLLLDRVRAVAWPLVLTGVGTQTEIRLGRFGTQQGLRGACTLAVHELAVACNHV